VVRWLGEPSEFILRLNWEALRGGLGQAKEILVLADGGRWIWNLAQDHWAGVKQLLDFYHGSEHLWESGRASHGQDKAQAKPWVERRLHQLRHGQERRVLKEIAALKRPREQPGQVVRREQNCFAGHAGRMSYQTMADRGWPPVGGFARRAPA